MCSSEEPGSPYRNSLFPLTPHPSWCLLDSASWVFLESVYLFADISANTQHHLTRRTEVASYLVSLPPLWFLLNPHSYQRSFLFICIFCKLHHPFPPLPIRVKSKFLTSRLLVTSFHPTFADSPVAFYSVCTDHMVLSGYHWDFCLRIFIPAVPSAQNDFPPSLFDAPTLIPTIFLPFFRAQLKSYLFREVLSAHLNQKVFFLIGSFLLYSTVLPHNL